MENLKNLTMEFAENLHIVDRFKEEDYNKYYSSIETVCLIYKMKLIEIIYNGKTNENRRNLIDECITKVESFIDWTHRNEVIDDFQHSMGYVEKLLYDVIDLLKECKNQYDDKLIDFLFNILYE